MPTIRQPYSTSNAVRLKSARPAGGFGDILLNPGGPAHPEEEETPDPVPTGLARLTITGMRVAAGGLQIGVAVMIDGEPATGTVSENAMVGGMWTTLVPPGEHRVRVTEIGVARETIVDVPAGGVTIPLSGIPFLGETGGLNPGQVGADITISGMPRGGSTYLDGSATDSGGRWADAAQTVYVVRVPMGQRRVRVTDPAGNARTWSGNVGANGAMIAWNELTPVARSATGGAKAPDFRFLNNPLGGGSAADDTPVEVRVDDAGNPLGWLRIAAMPPSGTITIDGALPPGYPAGARWDGATWVIQAPQGSNRLLRIQPPTGGGPARTARVTIGATGDVDFTTMVPESAPDAPPPPPPPPPPAATTGTVVYRPTPTIWTIPAPPQESTTAAVLRAGAGTPAIPLTPDGENYRASVPAGTYTLEVIVQPPVAGRTPQGAPLGPIPPAQQYTAPVTVTAGGTVTIERAQLTATPRVPMPGEGEPPPSLTGLGRVVVRTVLADANAMVQRLTGSQGEVDAGRSMVRGADGSLSVSVAPGTYQLVAWQGDLTRQNVRQAPVTVIAGQTASYSYTGAALAYDGGAQTGSGDQVVVTAQDRAARYAAWLRAMTDADPNVSRNNLLLSPYLWQLGGK